jgi:hypothetical protein
VEQAVDIGGAAVAVLGCGSVGSLAAWCLSSAGVATLELADRERLEPDNRRRHVCGAADQNRPKAEAVADFLRARFPGLAVTPQHFCFLDRPASLRGLLEHSAIVLAAVDDEAPKHLIDAMAREMGRPVVYTGVYGGGWGAEAIVTDPAAGTPCYACTARGLSRFGIPVELPPSGPGYALPAPGAAPSEWVQADLTGIMPCAALAARLVVARLARHHGADGPWHEFGSPGVNAWRLALRRVPAWGFGPWELRPVPVRPQPGCPACGYSTASPSEFCRLLSGGPL